MSKDVALAGWDDFMAALRMGDAARGMDDGRHAFRGESCADYPLLPSIGRFKPHNEKCERYMLDSFKRQAMNRVARPPATDFGWMALARHYRLPTRLLDWSISPLVAAWFAVSGPDGYGEARATAFAIWVLQFEESDFVETGDLDRLDPFALKRDFVLASPPHFTERVTAQRGFFSLHRYPDRPFVSERLTRFVIPGAERAAFMHRLDFLGINHASINPDLDGLGLQLGWFYAQALASR